MGCRAVEPSRQLMWLFIFVRLPLGLMGTIGDHLADLPTDKLHIRVFPLRVGSGPVEQLLVVVPFQNVTQNRRVLASYVLLPWFPAR